MNRHTFTVFFLVLCLVANASIPAGYYDPCYGKKDAALKTALSLIVRQGDRYHYGTNDVYHQDRVAVHDTVVFGVFYAAGTVYAKAGNPKRTTWQVFPTLDRQIDGSVWDMYSNNHRFFPPSNGESACKLEIEHCMPKSWWGASGAAPDVEDDHAYCDLFNLNPSDKAANNNKSNYPPGNVIKVDKFNNGSFKMDATPCQYGNFPCFEPADCYKGDFARTYFYMVTAYEDKVWASSNMIDSILDNNSYLEFRPWLINVLLEWHRNDPVSQKEIDRQNAIYGMQSNRNPYIDYPELVEYIWGNKKGQNVDFSQLTCTQDPSYIPQDENIAFVAYPAQNVWNNYFEPSWNGFYDGDYTLEIYSNKQVVGHNDTLLSLPGLGLKELGRIAGCTVSEYVQSDGTQSILMGKSVNDGWISFNNLNLTQPAKLVFRASTVGSVGSRAQLDIFLNGHTQADTSITDLRVDELMYTYSLPANTQSIKIASVGGDTKIRACMQQLFIIRGDLHEELNYVIEPEVIHRTTPSAYKDTFRYAIFVPKNPGQQLYYRVTTAAGWQSNEVPVTLGPNEYIRHYVTLNSDHATVTGEGFYQEGTQATLTAQPDQFYFFSHWSNGSTDNPYTIVVTQDSNLTAIMEKDMSKVAITINYTQGKVTVNDTTHQSGTTAIYNVGDTVRLKASTVTYYKFDDWGDGNSDNPRTLILTQDTTLTTSYSPKSYMVNVSAENGTVTGTGSYLYNEDVTLTATPDVGYSFVEWKKGDTSMSTDNPYTFTLKSAGITLTAYFEKNTGINDPAETIQPVKFLQNGKLFIMREGKVYSPTGVRQ